MNPGLVLAEAYNTFVSSQQTFADEKSGRFRMPDGSVRPLKDTGFRATKIPPVAYVAPAPRQRTVFEPDYVHVDDIIDLGPASIRGEKINAVRCIGIKLDQAEAREMGYVRESIMLRKKREQKENEDASKN